MASKDYEKEKCPDCKQCQMCSESRCSLCRQGPHLVNSDDLGPIFTYGQYLERKKRTQETDERTYE